VELDLVIARLIEKLLAAFVAGPGPFDCVDQRAHRQDNESDDAPDDAGRKDAFNPRYRQRLLRGEQDGQADGSGRECAPLSGEQQRGQAGRQNGEIECGLQVNPDNHQGDSRQRSAHKQSGCQPVVASLTAPGREREQ